MIPAQSLPAKFHLPVSAAVINAWINASDQALIRRHAWTVWAAMSSASGAKLNGKPLPIWETWYGSEEVFSPQASDASGAVTLLKPDRVPSRAFIAPRQLNHMALKTNPAAVAGSSAAQVVSFNKFDPTAAEFIVSPHSGPGGGSFHYNASSGLAALNAAWPAGTPANVRTTAEFPATGIELKPVMSLVLRTGLTPLPLWQGPAGSTNATNPTPETWKTCVLVDPSTKAKGGIRKATADEIKTANPNPTLACQTYLYGPLSLLYSFQMSAAEAAAFTKAQGSTAKAGDYAVLDAMHVNSKEIPFWTWQTFYWQPGADTPNGFPGSKKNMPASVKSPWNNYAMCTAYSQTTKPGGSAMQVCFNPYLETSPGIPAGITSNCMSCHGVALVPGASANYPPDYTKPIDFFNDPGYFTDTVTRTDFSWAVAGAP